MAGLPDPTPGLSAENRAALERMGRVRAVAEGRPSLGQVYVRMFNHPEVAQAVGALGERLRFHGVLPDRARELVILRFAARRRLAYAWAHHQRPARSAGLENATIEAVLGRAPLDDLADRDRAVLGAVDAVADELSIPAAIHDRLVEAYGNAGIVELVALCGLYGLIEAMVTSFDIPLEEGLPRAPF